MDAWLDELAGALGEPALGRDEAGTLLRVAREVAHGVERKLAPLSTFLVGAAVGRRVAQGEDRSAAFAEDVSAALDLIPEREEGDPTAG